MSVCVIPYLQIAKSRRANENKKREMRNENRGAEISRSSAVVVICRVVIFISFFLGRFLFTRIRAYGLYVYFTFEHILRGRQFDCVLLVLFFFLRSLLVITIISLDFSFVSSHSDCSRVGLTQFMRNLTI